MCAAAAAAAVMAQAPAPPGCVLPVADAPPVVQQVDTPLPPQAAVAEGPGFSLGLPVILGLAALAAGAYLLLAGDDDENEGAFSQG
jgi:hypothetical protein